MPRFIVQRFDGDGIRSRMIFRPAVLNGFGLSALVIRRDFAPIVVAGTAVIFRVHPFGEMAVFVVGEGFFVVFAVAAVQTDGNS